MSLKKECDLLWAKCIKKLADDKSEISGRTKNLHAHHIVGKPNYRLRYELKNGICLTAGEHFYGIHNQGRQKQYEDKIRQIKGEHIYEELNLLRHVKSKTDLKLIKIYLREVLNGIEVTNN